MNILYCYYSLIVISLQILSVRHKNWSQCRDYDYCCNLFVSWCWLCCALQEDPYIMLDQPTACTATKGTICQMVADSELGKHSISIVNNLERKFIQKTLYFNNLFSFFEDLWMSVFDSQLMSTELKKSEIQTQQYLNAAPVSVLICWGNSPMISHSTLLLNEWKMEPGEELWMAAGTDL